VNEWQPIETAPKDGTSVWVFCGGEQAAMRWLVIDGTSGLGLWVYSDGLLSDVDPEPEEPTHWMPLPKPPVSA
jgi:hypothetical protein